MYTRANGVRLVLGGWHHSKLYHMHRESASYEWRDREYVVSSILYVVLEVFGHFVDDNHSKLLTMWHLSCRCRPRRPIVKWRPYVFFQTITLSHVGYGMRTMHLAEESIKLFGAILYLSDEQIGKVTAFVRCIWWPRACSRDRPSVRTSCSCTGTSTCLHVCVCIAGCLSCKA